MGVRLSGRQLHGGSSLSHVNDRTRLKLDKFSLLLSATNVNLG